MSTPTPCFVANWKMHKTIAESDAFVQDLNRRMLKSPPSHSKIVIAPPFTSLSGLASSINTCETEIELSAQNVHFEKKGAYTGEISTEMLKEAGCLYVIVGHSERRNLFGESDQQVYQKLLAVLEAGMRPILCIGESLEARQAGHTWKTLERQLSIALGQERDENHLCDQIPEWMVAYEPVWAIGSGQTPTPSEVSEIHEQIQGFIVDFTGKPSPPVLYGGSVSKKNIAAFMKESSIGGVLVGGASLNPESFHEIITLGSRSLSDLG